MRILVADDNALSQQVLLRFLLRMGYRADIAANGYEVLQALQRNRYDVVLMDLQMPEMDGLEASKRIASELEAGSRPRIVAITASTSEEDRQRCEELGLDAFLLKPVRIESLAEVLGECRPLEDPRPDAAEA